MPTSSVTSVDGTSIAVRITGGGSPVVLLHGICADATSWLPIAGLLKNHHTVYSVDRRGRGLSGDAVGHSLDLEIADLLKVLSMFDTPVPVLAHSYGATIAVLAAARTDLISDLVAYEPLLVPITTTLNAVADQLESCVQRGDRDLAVVHLLEQFGMPGLVERLKAIPPAWDPLVHNVHTVGRELRSLIGIDQRLDDLKTVKTPVRLLVGTSSVRAFAASAQVALERLPLSKLVTLNGHNHFATLVAPDLIAGEVLKSNTKSAGAHG